MLLSLLETILILYLMDKGCSSQEKLQLMDDCKDKEKVSNDPGKGSFLATDSR